MPHLGITKVAKIHCNIANNDYQEDSRVLHTFAPIKSFSQLFDISREKTIFKKNFNSEFSCIELWFTDENSKPLYIYIYIHIFTYTYIYIYLMINLLIKLQGFQKVHNKIIQKQLQMRMVKMYLKKYIYISRRKARSY